MKEICIHKIISYHWTLRAGNGRPLANSRPYKTKFHCIKGAIQVIRKPYIIIDEVKDRRRRA